MQLLHPDITFCLFLAAREKGEKSEMQFSKTIRRKTANICLRIRFIYRCSIEKRRRKLKYLESKVRVRRARAQVIRSVPSKDWIRHV